MAVPESSPYKNVKEFVEAWKAGKVKNYASLGPGTSAHLIAERMKTLTGLDLKHIPFPPGPQAPLALGRGEIDMMFYGLASFQPGLQAKTIRLIGIAMPQRSALTPDLPTLREQGYDGIIQAWYGICAPKGTPKPIIDKLAKAIIDTVNDPAIVKKLNDAGTDAAPSTSAEDFAKFIETNASSTRTLLPRPAFRRPDPVCGALHHSRSIREFIEVLGGAYRSVPRSVQIPL